MSWEECGSNRWDNDPNNPCQTSERLLSALICQLMPGCTSSDLTAVTASPSLPS